MRVGLCPQKFLRLSDAMLGYANGCYDYSFKGCVSSINVHRSVDTNHVIREQGTVQSVHRRLAGWATLDINDVARSGMKRERRLGSVVNRVKACQHSRNLHPICA